MGRKHFWRYWVRTERISQTTPFTSPIKRKCDIFISLSRLLLREEHVRLFAHCIPSPPSLSFVPFLTRIHLQPDERILECQKDRHLPPPSRWEFGNSIYFLFPLSFSRYQISSVGLLLIVVGAKHQQLFICAGLNLLNNKIQSSAPFMLRTLQSRGNCPLFCFNFSSQLTYCSSFLSKSPLLWNNCPFFYLNLIYIQLWPFSAFTQFISKCVREQYFHNRKYSYEILYVSIPRVNKTNIFKLLHSHWHSQHKIQCTMPTYKTMHIYVQFVANEDQLDPSILIHCFR